MQQKNTLHQRLELKRQSIQPYQPKQLSGQRILNHTHLSLECDWRGRLQSQRVGCYSTGWPGGGGGLTVATASMTLHTVLSPPTPPPLANSRAPTEPMRLEIKNDQWDVRPRGGNKGNELGDLEFSRGRVSSDSTPTSHQVWSTKPTARHA